MRKKCEREKEARQTDRHQTKAPYIKTEDTEREKKEKKKTYMRPCVVKEGEFLDRTSESVSFG